MCDTTQLVPIRILTDGSWPSGYDAGCNSGWRGVPLRFWGPRFNTGIHLMKQFAHNWYLPYCQCTETCSHAFFIQNNIYTPVPGVSSPVENSSCPESTRRCSQCVTPLSWCQSVFSTDGSWLCWVVTTLAATVGDEWCLLDSGVPGSTLASTSWSNSLIIGIYPTASARRHVLMFPSYKIIQRKTTKIWNFRHDCVSTTSLNI